MVLDNTVTGADDPRRDHRPPAGLADALTREHHDIDAGIEDFLASIDTTAHGGGGPRVEALLAAMRALRRHIYLEEVFLFPSIQAAGMAMPILVMFREHGQLWRAMDTLADVLADSSTDQTARDRIAARCRELLTLLDRHNSKEEPVIYPHIDADLTVDARAELAAFLRTGDIPDGWTCQQAAT